MSIAYCLIAHRPCIFVVMTYNETLHFLYSKLPMFSRIGVAAYRKDLTNTIRLCEFLGNPHTKFKSIHVAGTNGKGSVSHMLAAILQKAGYKTGLYTSPHLKDFRERIRINGEFINEQFVIDFTEKIKNEIDALDPSFFEITVGMAFEYFAKEKVDIAVIETGLGGRLDSTNIITPEVSAITNIGFDHMNILGDTLEKIAFEKAGIMKPGVPAVVGEFNAITDIVFRSIAAQKNVPLTYASKQRHVEGWKWQDHHLIVEVSELHRADHFTFELDLPGIYQAKNLLTVLETCAVLHHQGWRTDLKTIKEALKHVKKTTGLHGRWETIHTDPKIVLDVAHNEDGIKQLLQQIELTDHEKLHIVIGLVKDKDINNVLSLLPRTAQYYFTKAQIPRALEPQLLKSAAAKYSLKGLVFDDVNEALREAKEKASCDDLIIVCGSVFVVGEVVNGE